MRAAMPLALLLLTAETAGPPAPAPGAAKPAAAAPAQPACENRQERQGEIVICAERPNGYRLNPDLQEAKRELKLQKLKRPENFVHNDCATVGPMGCRGGPYINLLAAAATAAEMAKRLAEGKEIGSMFQTTPGADRISALPRRQAPARGPGSASGSGRQGQGGTDRARRPAHCTGFGAIGLAVPN